MIDLFKCPDKKDMKELNKFLTNTHEDAKPLTLTQAHGFLCAIVSAPSTIMPSEYHHALFRGDPEFKSPTQMKTIISLIAALTNSISSELERGTFIPLIWNHNGIVDYHAASLELVGEWCDGYLMATEMDPIWDADRVGCEMLLPLAVMAGLLNLTGKRDPNNNIITDDLPHKISIREQIPSIIADIYKFWTEKRKNSMPCCPGLKPRKESTKIETRTRSEPKIGRNDPCPCGSNEKFKKCCGAPDRILH